jgi:hypothetical protein
MAQLNLILMGLEPEYLRRLAIYAKNRLGERVSVRIRYRGKELQSDRNSAAKNRESEAVRSLSGKEAEPEPGRSQTEKGKEAGGGRGDAKKEAGSETDWSLSGKEAEWVHVLAAPEAVLRQIRISRAQRQRVLQIPLVTDRSRETEDSIYAYQSCEIIYRRIFRIYQSGRESRPAVAEPADRRLWLVLGAAGTGESLAFALTCAQIRNEARPVLFLDFSSFSGMRTLLELNPEEDLTDLILGMRNGSVQMEAYTSRLGSLSCVLPAENPTAVSELTPEDLRQLLRTAGESGLYEELVILMEQIPSGAEIFMAGNCRVFCVTQPGRAGDCAGEEMERFCISAGARPGRVIRVKLPPLPITGSGEWLLQEWRQGSLGEKIRGLLEQAETRID